MNRQEDLIKVFDKRWKANHNDDVKNAKEKEKKFMNKMFNNKMPNMSNNKNTIVGYNGVGRNNNIRGK